MVLLNDLMYQKGLEMRKQLFSVVAISLLSASAFAEAPKEGWFAGVSAGAAKVNENAFRGPTYVVQSDVVSIDNKDASLQVWGGYRLADWVSMEARYSTLGEYVTNGDGTAGQDQDKNEAEALSVHMKLIWPFGDSGFDVYGQLGLGIAKWDSDFTVIEFEDNTLPINGQTRFSASGTEPAVSYGVGVRWTIIPQLTMQLAVDAYKFDGSSTFSYFNENYTPPGPLPVPQTQIINQQVKFDADILTTSLGLQYNF